MSTTTWQKRAAFAEARRRGEPYVYQHARSGAVLDRRTLVAVLGAPYKGGAGVVRAAHFRLLDTSGENPFQ